ncbi:hypothetical protein [Methylophilus sp. 14]|uniref:hypothetical protein n=1 Tax=Methylophilus sp. 14 TaxID=2781019 RepID=UPI0018907EBB|nr:hypothetical protein [Methylophilus sp. 14]MBF4987439.1 hypothetical protein [Methylophilus sp. 14]
MKQIFLGWLTTCLMVTPAWADTHTPAQSLPAVKVVSVHNPAQYAGIQIGDVLQRSITLSVSAQEQLNDSSLPLKGLQRNGIELRQWQVSSASQADKKIYTLVFDYQVFASSGKPIQLQLPVERIRFNSGAAAELPAWRFWLMAQLPDRLQPAKPTVIAQYHASMLETDSTQRWLVLSLLLAVIGSLVLLYRNADWTWLPMMNGHFAKAYHRLKRLPATAEGQKQAALIVQHAFNQHYGQQMLSSQVGAFVQQQPVFQSLETQIQAFFVQANAVLYGGQLPAAAEYLQQCKTLTRQLRDCERRV